MVRSAAGALAMILGPMVASIAGPAAPAGEFKVVVAGFEAGETAVATAEWLSRGEQIVRWSPGASEFVVLDPASGRCDLIDTRRKVRALLTVRRLDEALDALRGQLAERAAAVEKAHGRAGAIAAAMTRALLDDRPAAPFDPAAGTLTLSNAHVTITAAGVADDDPARRDRIAAALDTSLKLGSLREPEGLPPFGRLAALRELSGTHHRRPTELTCLYRLAGPPRRLRWTYRLVPGLSDRDREALDRLDRFRREAPLRSFADYEAAEAPRSGIGRSDQPPPAGRSRKAKATAAAITPTSPTARRTPPLYARSRPATTASTGA